MIDLSWLEEACVKYDESRNDYTRDTMILALNSAIRDIVQTLNELESERNKK